MGDNTEMKSNRDGERNIPIELSWACIHNNPTTWGLGIRDYDQNTLNEIRARVFRKPDGSWSWSLVAGCLPSFRSFGNEPSRTLAMETVIKLEWNSSQDGERHFQLVDLAVFTTIEPHTIQFQGFASDLKAAESWLKGGVEIDLLEVSPVTGVSSHYHTHDRGKILSVGHTHSIGDVAPLDGHTSTNHTALEKEIYGLGRDRT